MHKSQKEVAKAVGVTPSYLSLVESGKRNPSIELVERAVASLGVPLEALFLLAASKGIAESDAATAHVASTLTRLLAELRSVEVGVNAGE